MRSAESRANVEMETLTLLNSVMEELAVTVIANSKQQHCATTQQLMMPVFFLVIVLETVLFVHQWLN